MMQSSAALENDRASVAGMTGFPWIVGIIFNAKYYQMAATVSILRTTCPA